MGIKQADFMQVIASLRSDLAGLFTSDAGKFHGMKFSKKRSTSYIFEHILKTGGTSFNLSYIPKAFKREEYFVINGHLVDNKKDIDYLISESTNKNKYKIITGHNAGKLRPYYPHTKYIAMVRDPIDRALSGYTHAKFHSNDSYTYDIICKEMNQKNISLLRFIEDDLFAKRLSNFASFHNGQAKILLGDSYESIDLDDESAVMKTLYSRFHVIGYTEAFELFLFYLHVTEGFPLILYNNRLVLKDKRNFSPTTEEVITIKQLNKIDMVIYELIKKDFDRRVSKIWNDERERLYTSYIDTLKRFRENTKGDENVSATFIERIPEGARRIPEALTLESIHTYDHWKPSSVEHSGHVCTVTTGLSRWSYAAEIEINKTLIPDMVQTVYIGVRLIVLSGLISICILCDDGKTLISEDTFFKTSETIERCLIIEAIKDTKSIIIRNVSPGNNSSVVVIEAISLYIV